MILAIDCETTGLDTHHGCRPFFVSACDDSGKIYWWEWDVDPRTRNVSAPESDLRDIRDLILSARSLVFHNALFDVGMLEAIGALTPAETDSLEWWSKAEETVIASHVIDSGGSHGLKDLALEYLEISDDDQQELRDATNEARKVARRLDPMPAIAAPGHHHSPSMTRAPKVGWWVMDTWLPRMLVLMGEGPDPEQPWLEVLRTYAIQDAERTIGLWLQFIDILQETRLDGPPLREQYRSRCALLPAVYRMQKRGITLSTKRLREQYDRIEAELATTRSACHNLAGGRIDNLNSSKQLQGLLYGSWGLKPPKATKNGWSTDKEALAVVAEEVEPRSKPAAFLRNLNRYKKCKTALQYMEGYRLAGAPAAGGSGHHTDDRECHVCGFGTHARECGRCGVEIIDPYLVLHPNFNITGTATTRFSSNNPNAQNISKDDDFNLRAPFGPLPGREWYAIDYSNIELRIFAYCSGDENLIAAFDRGESVHLIVAKALHPELYAECEADGVSFKDRYKATWYQWVKNGIFAMLYGASPRKANVTFHVPGAYDLIAERLPLVREFMQSKFNEAEQCGYVTCLGGYPLTVQADKPHVAVNYFVQGTAGWCLVRAMPKIDAYLRTLPDHHMIMTIHDELVFDFPIPVSTGTSSLSQTRPRGDGEKPAEPKYPRGKRPLNKRQPMDNESIVKRVSVMMEESGIEIGIPLAVSVDRITTSWAKERPLDGARPLQPVPAG